VIRPSLREGHDDSPATVEERVYISAGGDPVVMLKRANGTGSFVPYYLHRDPIGSPVAITNSGDYQ